jgi:uncharacterized Zn finger protein
MAETRQQSRDRTSAPGESWSALTWEDLERWAGARSVSRGRSYQKSGRVTQLGVTERGALRARVQGTEPYDVRIHLDAATPAHPTHITSVCSCPVRFACKHAVAAIIAYLNALESSASVPVHSDDDREDALTSKKPKPRTRTKKISDQDIRRHLASKPLDELVDLVMQACDDDPQLRKAFVDELALAGGRFDDLLSEAQIEMRSLTAKKAWRNAWTGEGRLPDYSRLETRLRTLLDHGCADDVVQLGAELLRRGTAQIDHAHDEGETARAIGDCMDIISDALAHSSRRDEDKIISAIDMMLADEYGVCYGFTSMFERRWSETAWSAAADRLRTRLDDEDAGGDDRDERSREYRREKLGDWIVMALDNAGRDAEATELCIAEARKTDRYTHAVHRLIESGADDRAAELAREGLDATDPNHIGFISELQDLLCSIAARKGDWIPSAALAAERFFTWPSVDSYRELLRIAEHTEHLAIVQQAAMAFLETGRQPDRRRRKSTSKQEAPPWPLPRPPRSNAFRNEGRPKRAGPSFDVLIDLAIQENRPDDVLAWFDAREAAKPADAHRMRSHVSRDHARVAKVVEKTHPDRAVELYLTLANAIVAETNAKTYKEAGELLKHVRTLLTQSDREQDWPAIIEGFRTANRRKRRLMEVLDGVEGRPIIKPRRPRK